MTQVKEVLFADSQPSPPGRGEVKLGKKTAASPQALDLSIIWFGRGC